MSTLPKSQDVDVLVIGSGAGGLSAAVTAADAGLRVLIAERAEVLGGSSAWSGGWMWIPCNPLAREAGINEPAEAPRTYLKSVLGNRFDSERIDAFLRAGPQMVDFFHTKTALQFVGSTTICDIYGELPGAGTGGRSIIAAPYYGRALKDLLPLLRETLPETAFLGMPIMAGADLRAFLTVTRKLSSFFHVVKRLLRHFADLIVFGRAMQLVNGNALIARLMRSAADVGVQWRTASPATQLVKDGDKVVGAVLTTAEGQLHVRAKYGVVLATGGHPHAITDPSQFSVAVPQADGAGLSLAIDAGGVLDASGAAPGAWCPVSLVPRKDGSIGRFPHIIERAKPGIIGVRANGRRFVNEANGYHDYVAALLAATPSGEEVASWLVCDHDFITRYGLGIVRPWPVPHSYWIKNGYLKTGRTLAQLANACGIDPDGLVDTIEAYNHHALAHHDPEFGRGSTPFNRSQGDPDVGPNPNVVAIRRAPFYAVKVLAGSFGTFAGIKANAHGQVVNAQNQAISGLYVAGSDMASIMGGYYPAGGINLGPAMTFGYIVAQEIAKRAKATRSN
jgi:succinate dehydrogenase/fumarate reductase flavoprotein subunit